MRVRFRPEAVEDVRSARAWYEEQLNGLGAQFVSALEEAVDFIQTHPEAGAEVIGGVRRTLLRRFPYALYFRRQGDSLDIVACLYMRRSPRSWRRRV